MSVSFLSNPAMMGLSYLAVLSAAGLGLWWLWRLFTQGKVSRAARKEHKASRQKLDERLEQTQPLRRKATKSAEKAAAEADKAHERALEPEADLSETRRRGREIDDKYRAKGVILALILAPLMGAGSTIAAPDGPVVSTFVPCVSEDRTVHLRKALVALGEVGEDGAERIRLLVREASLLCRQRDALAEEVRFLKLQLEIRASLLTLAREDLDAYAEHVETTDRIVPKLRFERLGFCAGLGGGYDPIDKEWRGFAGVLYGLRW